MKFIVSTFAVVIAVIATGILMSSGVPAAADQLYNPCQAISGRAWVNPYPPNNSGSQYDVSYSGKGTSCAQATVWAKKFIVQHFTIGSNPLMPVQLKGPAGWKCNSGLDQNGYAYQGGCTKLNSGIIPTVFNWGPK
jgi:hypothetical protein